MIQAQFGRVGDRITTSYQMDGLPLGAKITDSSSTYTKIGLSQWQRDGHGTTYRTAQFNGGNYTVRSLPDGFEPCDRPQETAESYMFRFRDKALAAALTNGVSYEESSRTLDRAGVSRDQFPIGYGVQVTNTREVGQMPVGTVVWCGDPSAPEHFAVWRKTGAGGTWEQILGGARQIQPEVTVHTWNGSTEPPVWLTREGTEEDAEQIRQFRAKVWQGGWELKRSQSWCGTYEQVMRGLGVTEAAVREARTGSALVGTRVSPDQCAALAVGTVLRWDSTDSGEWAMFIRANETRNIAGTRKIAGSAESGNRNYHSSMQVVALAPENRDPNTGGLAQIPFMDRDFLNFLLPGSVFNHNSGRPQYVVGPDRRISPWRAGEPLRENGQYQSSDFGTYELLHYFGWDGVAR